MNAKKILFTLLVVVLGAASTFGNDLKAYFTYSTFDSPDKGPYIETYLSVIGNSAVYVPNENGNLQSTIEITMVFKQGDEVKAFKKYNLLSPEHKDSLTFKDNFMDQQRIPLPNGVYTFELGIRDVNAAQEPFSSSQQLTIDFPENELVFSDIELIESLSKTQEKTMISKSGYDIIPYSSDFFPEDFVAIAFYAELYNSEEILGKETGFLIDYYIESQETGKIVGDYRKFSREKAAPVNVLLSSFNIEKLPSGNYYLVLEAKNKENESLLKKKVFFQRSNPKATPIVMTDAFSTSFVMNIEKEALEEYIKCLQPISSIVELNFAENQLKDSDEELMRQYFYNFWSTRNSDDPEKEWKEYYEEVKIANKLFSTSIKKGYVTDRGRVYLKHGKPNTRSVFPSEPNAYPYEIWHYYRIGKFSNKRFVFYSPDVVTNDYPLLHSDMIGYRNYPQWKVLLHNRTNQPVDMDTQNQDGHYGSRANDFTIIQDNLLF